MKKLLNLLGFTFANFEPFIQLSHHANITEIFVLLEDCSYRCEHLDKITVLYKNHSNNEIVGFIFDKPGYELFGSVKYIPWCLLLKRCKTLKHVLESHNLKFNNITDSTKLKVYYG